MKAEFRKAHIRAYVYYSIRDINYKCAHMRFTESARNRQQSIESIHRFIPAICKAKSSL